MKIDAKEILNALIATAEAKIWATELQFHQGISRIDFWSMEPHASKNHRIQAYEIKVSRSDFQRDTKQKQELALKYSDRFWYVTPPNLIKIHEVPEWAGLMEWDGKTFTINKKPPQHFKAPPDWQFVAALIRSCGELHRDMDVINMQNRYLTQRNKDLERQLSIRSRRDMERMRRNFKAPPRPLIK